MTAKTAEGKSAPWAILFELEGTAVPVRKVLFEAIGAALKKERIEFGFPQFVRCGLHAVPEHMINDLATQLHLKPGARESAAAAVRRALEECFSGTKSTPLAPGLDTILNAARTAGAKIGTISWQTEDAARALSTRTGLDRWATEILSFSDVHHEFPGADTFLKGLKHLGADPHRSIALVTSRASSRSAIAAGMKCAVVSDEFTAFQDFGGADFVADAWKDLDPAQLFAD